ncbi:protein CUSTOS isoform X1 [Takifugu rubripes]|uniref:Protein CUSTOS n=1 Tax=Takifugu rubripes TaxID=31033 RepID=A0A3B5KF23_TAKRU|nr:protein CUSTOS isoform X1 [Takifugu rubripes]|eukprot:XP_011613773.1 PREDICTED: uncharacterized protein C12orf43 homolog [Takifugu rubripes]
MAADSDESSSSDEEALRRCQEAVWETKTDQQKDADSRAQQSKRVVVIEHEHDGNELQVSQGFRTHVARKLEHLLDSIITDTKTSSTEFKHGDNDDDDKGFRLFTTSIPGQTATEPKAPARRPPVPSSSDSDSEMETRIKEAAVSIEDLLPSTAVLASFEYGQIKENVIEKKKKKKRPPECTDDVSGHSEKDVLGKVKRKKKRRAAKEEATT